MVNFSTLGLSTVAICESMHYGPMLWKDNHDELNKCSMRKAKSKKTKIVTQRNRKESLCIHIASDATVVGQGCHMGTTSGMCNFNHLL